MSTQISGNKSRIVGRRSGNFVYDSAMEIIEEKIAYSINGRRMKNVNSVYIYKLKSKQIEEQYKKQNS